MKKFIREFLAFKWYLQESNRGHTDFQSDALPTELRHHCFCGAKVVNNYDIQVRNTGITQSFNFFCERNHKLFNIPRHLFILIYYLCSRFCKTSHNRDVAQLVAHYVRDVGVGRSSRLIPTGTANEEIRLPFLFVLRIIKYRNASFQKILCTFAVKLSNKIIYYDIQH